MVVFIKNPKTSKECLILMAKNELLEIKTEYNSTNFEVSPVLIGCLDVLNKIHLIPQNNWNRPITSNKIVSIAIGIGILARTTLITSNLLYQSYDA